MQNGIANLTDEYYRRDRYPDPASSKRKLSQAIRTRANAKRKSQNFPIP